MTTASSVPGLGVHAGVPASVPLFAALIPQPVLSPAGPRTADSGRVASGTPPVCRVERPSRTSSLTRGHRTDPRGDPGGRRRRLPCGVAMERTATPPGPIGLILPTFVQDTAPPWAGPGPIGRRPADGRPSASDLADRLCQQAEQLGADALWACDHLFWHGPCLECMMALTVAATATERAAARHLRDPAAAAPGPGGGQAGGHPPDPVPGAARPRGWGWAATPASTSRPGSTTTPGAASSTPGSPSCAGRGPRQRGHRPGRHASDGSGPLPAAPDAAADSGVGGRLLGGGPAAGGRARPTAGCPCSSPPPSTATPSSGWPRRSTGPAGPPTRSPRPWSCSSPSTTTPTGAPAGAPGGCPRSTGFRPRRSSATWSAGTADEVAAMVAAYREAGAEHVAVYVTDRPAARTVRAPDGRPAGRPACRPSSRITRTPWTAPHTSSAPPSRP